MIDTDHDGITINHLVKLINLKTTVRLLCQYIS